MGLDISADGGRGVVGVAVFAAVGAAIVHPNVDAGHTSACLPLILVFGQGQGLADDLLK